MQILDVPIGGLDRLAELQHLLCVLVAVEDARLVRIVHQHIVNEVVETVDLVFQDIANASHVDRIASEEERVAILFCEFVDETVRRVGGSADHFEGKLVQLHCVSVLQNSLHRRVCLQGKQTMESNIGVVTTKNWDLWVLRQYLAHT